MRLIAAITAVAAHDRSVRGDSPTIAGRGGGATTSNATTTETWTGHLRRAPLEVSGVYALLVEANPTQDPRSARPSRLLSSRMKGEVSCAP